MISYTLLYTVPAFLELPILPALLFSEIERHEVPSDQ